MKKEKNSKLNIAVIGSGPAGLMAADVLSNTGMNISLFEKNKGPGFKLLIAGSSGLNVGNDQNRDEFLKFMQIPPLMKNIFSEFFTKEWIQFLENLGLKTFLGSSGKYFVKEMKSARLLQLWIQRLQSQNVQFYFNSTLLNIIASPKSTLKTPQWELQLNSQKKQTFDGVVLALGGGSWLKNPPEYLKLFKDLNLKISELKPSNCGYHVQWTKSFLKEAEGQPLKGVLFQNKKGSLLGDIVITHYGLEGTPIYFYGTPGKCSIDLYPQMSAEMILKKSKKIKENLSPLRRLKKTLFLQKGVYSLLFHLIAKEQHCNLDVMIQKLKNFDIELLQSRPLSEAISSSGGLCFSELDENLMIKKYPGIFAAGELLDWDAPTGGFLVQTCVSQGYFAAQKMISYFQKKNFYQSE